MTFEQFRHLVQPLVNRFGDKVFSFDSISLLYRKLSLITPDQMRSLVEDVLLEFHFAPSLSKIIILAKTYTNEAYEAEKKRKLEEAEKYPCRKCNNSGWVEVVDMQSERRYVSAFRCACVVGRNFIGPKDCFEWSEKLEERFLPSYRVKGFQGGGTRNEHLEAADRVAYERLGKILGIDGDMEVVSKAFMNLSYEKKQEALLNLLKG